MFKIKKKYSLNESVILGIIGGIIIFLSLYPFWFFSEYSALGWYDEINSRIPASFLNNNLSDNQTFIHEYASGVGTNLRYGGEKFSLYRLFVSIGPMWIANLTFKFLSLFTFFIGLYYLLLTTFSANKIFSFSAALFGLFTSYLPYGWTLNGHGWDLSITIFVALSIFGRFKSFETNVLLGFITVLIAPFVSGPIFLFPFIFFLLIFIFIGFKKELKIDKFNIVLLTFMTITAITLYSYNWSYLYYVIIDSRDFSARVLETLSLNLIHGNFIDSLIHYVRYNSLNFIKYHTIFSVSSLIFAYIAIFVLSIVKKDVKVLIAITIIGCIFPIVFDSLVKALEVPVIQSYRWFDIFLYLLPIMSVISISYLLTTKFLVKTIVTPITICFLLLTFRGIYVYTDYSIQGLNSKGGVKVSEIYSKLKTLTYKNDRVVTDYSSIDWPTALYYGLHTFDGSQTTYSHRRQYFLAYGVSNPPKETYHRNNHYFYFSHNNNLYNIHMLEMANVRYILTSKSKIAQDSSPILSMNGISYNDLKSINPLKPLFIKLYGNIRLANDLFVFQLKNTWARVFTTNKITLSKHSFKQKEFYQDLKAVNKQEVLIAKDDVNNEIKNIRSDYNLNIESFSLTGTGAKIKINSGSGFIVFNQTYIPYWSGSCDGQKVNLIPVNGIMMGAYIPRGCGEMIFEYSSK